MKTFPFLLLIATSLAAHDLTTTDREALRAHILEEWTQQGAAALLPAVSKQGDEDASALQWEGSLRAPLVASSAPALQLAAAALASAADAPQTAKAFLPFTRLDLRADSEFLYVGSNGLPDHPMMVGITAWQQQVPLPQSYFGDNAWRIPLNPVPAKQPAMIKGRFLRGAIALAVNGIPIFNPQNNRGEISHEIGELDQWGGHCGRADDYHYHIVPLHLQARAGKDMPVAYALDGYPIYGLTEPDGSAVRNLDACHGHDHDGLGYHYHASNEYPYVIGGFHGEVVEREGQVAPQPRAQGVREALPALRGAKITAFESTGKDSYKLSYEVSGGQRSVSYSIKADGTYPFEFDDGRASRRTEVYTARQGGGGPPRGPGGEGKAKGKGKDKNGRPPPPENQSAAPKGSPGDDPNRKPWIQAHGAELDVNGDGVITNIEMAAEAKRAFAGYDANHDGRITTEERTAPGPRTAMGGFVKQHAGKIDSNADGLITEPEMLALAGRMFGKEDANNDGKLDPAEWQTVSTPETPRSTSGNSRPNDRLIKPSIADTMKLSVYADNWFMLYVNGRLVAVDSIQFTPHNVVSVDFLPEYPMTLAVLAKDNADPKTGMEYGTSIGDAGLCIKFADGTVTNAIWKAKNFFHGPVNGDTANPKVIQEPLPANWWATDFDDSTWKNAKEYTVEEIDPKQPYFESDFEGAKFIWTDDIALDNTVIFRTKVEKPGWTPRWNTKPDLDVSGVP